MKLLYGTNNPAKIEVMRKCLKEIGIDIIGLSDIPREIKDNAPEDGDTPLENARQKAHYYYNMLRMPVFSCDSGLYIDELPDSLQPGVHVRTINGTYFTDEEMLDYYSGLAKTYGDLTSRYKNSICLIVDENHIYERMDESIESEPFLITSKPHSIRKPGFPLDSLSVDKKSGSYYYDMEAKRLEKVAVEDGFIEFFREALEKLKDYQEIEVGFLDKIEDEKLAFAVMVTKSQEQYVFCKHRERDTLEVPGGRREPFEDILTTAKRELYEETGAVHFDLEEVGVYSVLRKNPFTKEENKSYGMLYMAEVYEFEEELHNEIEKIILTDTMPDKWTYPDIQPKLFEYIRMKVGKNILEQ